MGGRKLMGSAQSRRRGHVLQHGSLPLVGDITRLVTVLALPQAVKARLAEQLAQRACTLSQALEVDEESPLVSFQHVAQVLAEGFAEALNLELIPGALTPGELRRAGELIREKFANPEWTESR